MTIETDYPKFTSYLRTVRAPDTGNQVVYIWGYRVKRLSDDSETDKLLSCCSALIPELKHIVVQGENDVGAKIDMAYIANTVSIIAKALCETGTPSEDEEYTKLVEDTVDTLFVLTPPETSIAFYGRENVERTIEYIKNKEPFKTIIDGRNHKE
jgi:hypothetical protein